MQGFGQHDENLRKGREARDRTQAALRQAMASGADQPRVGRFLLPEAHVSATVPHQQDESAGGAFVGSKGRLAARQESAEHFLDRCGYVCAIYAVCVARSVPRETAMRICTACGMSYAVCAAKPTRSSCLRASVETGSRRWDSAAFFSLHAHAAVTIQPCQGEL